MQRNKKRTEDRLLFCQNICIYFIYLFFTTYSPFSEYKRWLFLVKSGYYMHMMNQMTVKLWKTTPVPVHTVILCILNLLYKIHRLLYKKWFCYANSFFASHFCYAKVSNEIVPWMWFADVMRFCTSSTANHGSLLILTRSRVMYMYLLWSHCVPCYHSHKPHALQRCTGRIIPPLYVHSLRSCVCLFCMRVVKWPLWWLH